MDEIREYKSFSKVIHELLFFLEEISKLCCIDIGILSD